MAVLEVIDTELAAHEQASAAHGSHVSAAAERARCALAAGPSNAILPDAPDPASKNRASRGLVICASLARTTSCWCPYVQAARLPFTNRA